MTTTRTHKITPEKLWSRQQISSLAVDYDLWNEKRASIQAISWNNLFLIIFYPLEIKH